MKKWQDLVAIGDPDSYYDVNGVTPTKRGTYETVPGAAASTLVATGRGTVRYAFVGRVLSGTREYIVDSLKIWENSAGILTDRTGGVTIGAVPMMANYGNITLCAMGVGTPTVSSSGGNFAALAGAPQAEIVVVQSNAAVFFNTSTSSDGWAASDVGDYTNYTTGEAASGRFIQTSGPVTAAVAWGRDIIVFKDDSIYRMTYVGGTVKWTTELLERGVGCSKGGGSNTDVKHWACAGKRGIMFLAPGPQSSVSALVYDGVSEPVRVNPLTTIPAPGAVNYNVIDDVYCIVDTVSSPPKFYYYNASSQAWGRSSTLITSSAIGYPLMGESTARASTEGQSVTPAFCAAGGANQIFRYLSSYAGAALGNQIQFDFLAGDPSRKTTFIGATPIVRRRRSQGLSNPTCTAELRLYRELQDIEGQNPAVTRTALAESGQRSRFDFLAGSATDNFAKVSVLYTVYDVEMDDIVLSTKDAGAN